MEVEIENFKQESDVGFSCICALKILLHDGHQDMKTHLPVRVSILDFDTNDEYLAPPGPHIQQHCKQAQSGL